MKLKLKKKFKPAERKIEALDSEQMKMIVGSGNENAHSIPPELFEAMFVNPARMK
ncbi:hypothetical protein ACYSNW_06320 [Enterococcus sp. LJL99]